MQLCIIRISCTCHASIRVFWKSFQLAHPLKLCWEWLLLLLLDKAHPLILSLHCWGVLLWIQRIFSEDFSQPLVLSLGGSMPLRHRTNLVQVELQIYQVGACLRHRICCLQIHYVLHGLLWFVTRIDLLSCWILLSHFQGLVVECGQRPSKQFQGLLDTMLYILNLGHVQIPCICLSHRFLLKV